MSDTPETLAAVQEPVAPAPAEQAPVDDFDKPRAMETIRKQREELKEAKARIARLAELEAAEQAKRDADLSEVERLRKQYADLEAKHQRESAELQRMRVIDTANRTASKESLAFHDGVLADAFALGLFAALEYDDAGEPRNMVAVLRSIAKERPYLLRGTMATGADLDARARGTTSKQDEEARRLEKNAGRWGIRLAK